MRRSPTAAVNTADRCRYMTETVAGDRVTESRFTSARRSDGRIVASGRSPRYGYTCNLNWRSTCSWVVGRCAWFARQVSAYSLSVILPAPGATYCPVTTEAVT